MLTTQRQPYVSFLVTLLFQAGEDCPGHQSLSPVPSLPSPHVPCHFLQVSYVSSLSTVSGTQVGPNYF